MTAGHLTWPDSVIALALPTALFSTALGLVLPHAMAVSLEHYPHMAGTASSLLGFIQMGLSAAASALAGQLLGDTPMPMLYIMIAITALGLLLAHQVHRRQQTLDT